MNKEIRYVLQSKLKNDVWNDEFWGKDKNRILKLYKNCKGSLLKYRIVKRIILDMVIT